MAREGKPIFDVRKLRAGRSYTVFTTNDSLETAQIVIYEINKIEYVVYDLRDTLKIYKAKKPVTVETKTASGIIKNSLNSYSIAYLISSIFSFNELFPVPKKKCFLSLWLAIFAINSFFSLIDTS